MNEKKWTDDERDEAFDRGMETMQRVALELYRRGREPLLAELEDCRARNADLRTMLEQVTRDRDHVEESLVRLEAQRDEARSALVACPDCAMWAERSARWHDDMQRAERERAEARAEVEHAYREGGALYEAKIAEREAFRCGAEAMREACAKWVDHWVSGHVADKLRDMPIPEEP